MLLGNLAAVPDTAQIWRAGCTPDDCVPGILQRDRMGTNFDIGTCLFQRCLPLAPRSRRVAGRRCCGMLDLQTAAWAGGCDCVGLGWRVEGHSRRDRRFSGRTDGWSDVLRLGTNAGVDYPDVARSIRSAIA